MAKSKAMPTKTSQTKDSPINSTKSSHTAVSLDPGNQSESTLRQSKRLQGIPAYAESSDKGSPLVGVTDSDKPLDDCRSADAQSLPTNSNTLSDVVLDKPDVDASSEYNKTYLENSDDDDFNDIVNRSFKNPTSAKSKKRKAAISGKNKVADSTLAPPPKKKQKINNPTPKVQRKATISRPKTAKERHLAASAEDTRPLPWGEPDVWAETRPELCEALQWFRCWQGASHTHNGYVFGMLLDEDKGERAYMDEIIAITRAGGGIKKTTSGEFRQMEDQDSEKARIKAFIHNEEEHIPMHLIIGQNNVHCPSKIPHRYCVTPEVQITDHWDERSNSHVVVKFRFEKTDLVNKTWYAAEDSSEIPIPTDIKALRMECPTCHVTKPQVFASGWMCLNSKCTSFWTLDGTLASEAQEYNPEFLNERWTWDGFLPPYAIKPELIQAKTTHGHTFAAARQCWEGIVCELCGRCNLRQHWDAWRCRTEGCPFEHRIPMDVIAASSVAGDAGYGFQGHGVSQDIISEPSIKREVRKHGLYRECLYQLGNGLTITHLISNNVINSAPGGPDDLFYQLQKEDIGLERLPMKQSVVEQTYSRHFSHNFVSRSLACDLLLLLCQYLAKGMPYNYVVGHDNSTSLADAPEAIKEAVRRMTWAAKRIVPGGDFLDFNEVLAVGYLEAMKMGYHDDGEESVGPTVVSISLGCPAKMKWRMKMRFWCGFKDKKCEHYDPDQPILPGCRKPEERRKLNELAKTASSAELDAAAQVALAFKKGESKTPPVVLEMDLRHGDYMVMHGASMQLYYEHTVVPSDKLRFALTCRCVKPEMVPEDMRSLGDFTLDPANAYDGDLELYDDHMKKYQASKVTKRRVPSVATQA